MISQTLFVGYVRPIQECRLFNVVSLLCSTERDLSLFCRSSTFIFLPVLLYWLPLIFFHFFFFGVWCFYVLMIETICHSCVVCSLCLQMDRKVKMGEAFWSSMWHSEQIYNFPVCMKCTVKVSHFHFVGRGRGDNINFN